MLIDWFTVGAQTLNFLVLVWLLKRFLYRPVLDAIDAREKRIADALADAQQRQQAADQARGAFEHQRSELERQQASLERQARDAFEAEHQTMLDAARAEADALQRTREDALVRESQVLRDAFARRNQQEVFHVARKVLADLADTSLDVRMTAAFVDRIGKLQPPEKAALVTALRTSAGALQVRSAFALTEEQKTSVQHALETVLDTRVVPQFEVSPELVGGLEVAVDGWKLPWTIDGYLSTLAQRSAELLGTLTRSAPQVAPAGASAPVPVLVPVPAAPVQPS